MNIFFSPKIIQLNLDVTTIIIIETGWAILVEKIHITATPAAINITDVIGIGITSQNTATQVMTGERNRKFKIAELFP